MDETIEQLERLKELGQITPELFDRLKASIVSAGDVSNVTAQGFGNLSGKIKAANEDLGNFLGGINVDALRASYQSVHDTVAKYAGKAVDFNEETGGALAKSAGILKTVLFPELSKGTVVFGDFAKIGAASSMDVSKSIGGLFNALPAGIQELIRVQESALGAKTGLYSLLQQSGSVDSVMLDLGESSGKGALSMDALNIATASMSKRLEEVGEKAQLAPGRVLEVVQAYGQMPGALNAMSSAADSSGERLDAMVNTIQLARGLGIDHMEVIKGQQEALFNWDTSLEKTNQNLVYMNRVTQEMGINRDIMTSFLKEATSGTNQLADGTESAVTLMRTLGKTLMDNGMSARGTSEMISGLAQRMRGLDVGKAAFISGQAGGPGGLAGAFQVEKMKQENDVAGIATMAADAFKNMGINQVVTLDDVEKNDALAGELMKQTELLKTLGLAKDTTEATRFLEAMKTGGFDELKNALQTPIEKQTDLQSEQNQLIQSGNELSSGMLGTLLLIANKQEALSRANAIASDEFLNKIVDKNVGLERTGYEGMTGATTGIGSNDAITNVGTKEKAYGVLNNTTPEKVQTETFGTAIDAAIELGKTLKGNVVDLLRDMPNLSNMTGDKSMTSGIVNTSANMVQENVNQLSRISTNQQVQNNVQRLEIAPIDLNIELTAEGQQIITKKVSQKIDALADDLKKNQGKTSAFSGTPDSI